MVNIIPIPTPPDNKETIPEVIFNPASETKWKIIGKMDWKIFLPIGVPITLYEMTIGNPESFLGKIGTFCLAIGAVNLASKFMFADHISGSPSLPDDIKRKNRKRVYIEIIIVIILFLVIVLWLNLAPP